MARPLRIEFPGATYHVTSRGNERRAIFRDDADRLVFLDILGEVVHRFGWHLHAFVLMTNHYHLFFMTPEANLARGMHRLNQLYAQYFNRRHHRCGHLFQGRYHSPLVENERYFLEVARYVVLNPVRAGMVQSAASWEWSSYRATAGLADSPDWLATKSLLDVFDCFDTGAARIAYQQFVASGEGERDLWDKLAGQIILGGDLFVAKIRTLIDERKKADREIPKAQRFVGRPALDAIIRAVSKHLDVPVETIRARHGGLARMLTAGLAVDEGHERLRRVARELSITSPSQITSLAERCRDEVSRSPELRELRSRIVSDLYPDPGVSIYDLPPPPGDVVADGFIA